MSIDSAIIPAGATPDRKSPAAGGTSGARSRNRSDPEVAKVSAPGDRESERHFTHFDASGQAHMVDVTDKDVTHRTARAGG